MFFQYARKAISELCKRVKNIGSWLSQQSEIRENISRELKEYFRAVP